MYKIVNASDNITTNVTGNWPSDTIASLLKENKDIIVISLYSNTIKVPTNINKENGNAQWKEYSF